MHPIKKSLSALILGAAIAGGGYTFLGSPMVPTAEARLKDYPKLQVTYDSLKDAKEYLENAPNEFHGHKKDAIHAVNEAMQEISLMVGEEQKRTITSNRPSQLAESHPRLRAAHERLQEGHDFLKSAKEDFRGHKDSALKAMDEAMHQIEICMKE